MSEPFPQSEDLDLNKVNKKERNSSNLPFEFQDLESAEEYLKWKESVPLEFRKLVERKVKGNDGENVINTGLLLTDQFLNVLQNILSGKSIEEGKLDKIVAKLIKNFNRVSTEVCTSPISLDTNLVFKYCNFL